VVAEVVRRGGGLNRVDAEKRLEDYLQYGIANEIYFADQAYALAEEIGRYANQINEANYDELFGPLQDMLSDRQILAVTKLFDRVGKYPTRSIPGTLELLEKHASLWRVRERAKLAEALGQAGADASYVKQLSDEELTYSVVEHYRTNLPDAATIRQIRDKVIVHNEAIEHGALASPTWGEALNLIQYAKGFLITIGSDYSGISFGDDSSNYILEDTAKHPANHLRRLLKKAGIVEGRQASGP
jgi:hypothetical protein